MARAKKPKAFALVVCVLTVLTGTQGTPPQERRIHPARSLLSEPRAEEQGQPSAGQVYQLANLSLAARFLLASQLDIRNSTLFAPTDMAFAALAEALRQNNTIDFQRPLADMSLIILKLHLIPNQVIRALSIPLGTTLLATAAGQNIAVTKGPSKMEVKGPGNHEPANVIAKDVMLGTNILHVIDRVLLIAL